MARSWLRPMMRLMSGRCARRGAGRLLMLATLSTTAVACGPRSEEDRIASYIERADKAAETTSYERAVDLYEKALALDRTNHEATFGRMTALANWGDATVKDAPARRARLGSAIAAAKTLVALTEDSDYFSTSRARALNIIAWFGLETAQTGAELTELLRHSDESIELVDDEWAYHDTRARILLRLGRTDDAYRVVARQPTFSDWADIVASDPYRQWFANSPAAEPFRKRAANDVPPGGDGPSATGSSTSATVAPPSLPAFERITVAEARRRHPDNDWVTEVGDSWIGKTFGEGAHICSHKGELMVDGDLDLDTAIAPCAVLLVDGDLVVHGAVYGLGSDFGMNGHLAVTGDLTAEWVYSGDSAMLVDGDASIEHVVYGVYNDGTFSVRGATTVPLVINDDHYLDLNTPDSTRIIDFSEIDEDEEDVFVDDVLSTDAELDILRVVELLEEGRSPLRAAS